MLTGPVARRYAQAVFEIGDEGKALDAWLTDVRLIADYFTNRQLIFILGEPNIRFERKEAIVRDLLGDKIHPEAMGLALTLVERGLVSLAGRIRTEFEKLYNDARGQAVAQVTSALPLDDVARASITRQLEQMTGKRIVMREQVDRALLGGVTARVGDTLIDGSVRRRPLPRLTLRAPLCPRRPGCSHVRASTVAEVSCCDESDSAPAGPP
ncbi:MAG: ATP synthase F1 subunit delta, partial [Ktedonobacterales bacterium]